MPTLPDPEIPWHDCATFAQATVSSQPVFYDVALMTIPPLTLGSGATLFVNIVSDAVSVDSTFTTVLQLSDSTELGFGSLGVFTELGGSSVRGAMWARSLHHARLSEGGTLRIRFSLVSVVGNLNFATGIVAAMIIDGTFAPAIAANGGYGRTFGGEGIPMQRFPAEHTGEGLFTDPYPWYGVSFIGRTANLVLHIQDVNGEWTEPSLCAWPGNGSYGFGAQFAGIAVIARNSDLAHNGGIPGTNGTIWGTTAGTNAWVIIRNWTLSQLTPLTPIVFGRSSVQWVG